MADTPVIKSATSVVAKKGKNEVASKKPQVTASHPQTSEMVNVAIKSLQERSGSSLQAIKKYISANYILDIEKQAQYIKKYLKRAVGSGEIIQTKGKGANGSFKLPSKAKAKSEAPKKAAPKKATSPKKVAAVEKKPKAKTVASPSKKQVAAKSDEKKKKAVVAVKIVKPASSVKASKQKSTKAKAAAKKPKSPKPKKASPVKKAAAAPKKK